MNPEDGWSADGIPARRGLPRRGFLTRAARAGLLIGLSPLLDACGTSTTATTVHHSVAARDFFKTAPVYDVRHYGADPTGRNDSATAIQAALNAATAAGRGVVQLPAGLYITSQILQIGSDTKLIGDGMAVSTIRAANGFSPDQVPGMYGLSVLAAANNAGGSNISISGLTFDGNQANVSSFPGWANEADSHCLYLRSVDNLQIKGIEIINAIRYSLFMLQCTHSYVSLCRITSGQETVASGGISRTAFT